MSIVDDYLSGTISSANVITQLEGDMALINTVKDDGSEWTLLHAAVNKGDINFLHEILTFLSDKNILQANIDKVTSGGATPLTYTVQIKSIEMFTKLKDSGADILARGEGGHSAVWTAYYYPGTDEIKAEIITILGDAGAMQTIADGEM